jgi:WD40 repeat protein
MGKMRLAQENGTLDEESKDQNAYLYSARFSNKKDCILAGGAGKNEVKVFDYTTGDRICTVGGLSNPVLTLEPGNASDKFVWGSTDSCVRIMTMENKAYTENIDLSADILTNTSQVAPSIG